MIRSLGTEFHLTQTLMHITGRLSDRFSKQLVGHEVGAGTGCKETTIFHKLHAAQINFTISFDGIFHRVS
mgnify:CR=1 FL=1